jgi:hypothetical protein
MADGAAQSAPKGGEAGGVGSFVGKRVRLTVTAPAEEALAGGLEADVFALDEPRGLVVFRARHAHT